MNVPCSIPELPVDDAISVNWKQVAIRAKFPGWSKVLEWMQWAPPSGATPKCFSWFELLALFHLWSLERGVESTAAHGTWRLHPKLQEYDAKKSCHSWSAYLTQLVRLLHPAWKPTNSRPANGRFQCWSIAVYCVIAEQAEQLLHEWFRLQCKDQRITKIPQLCAQPPA